MNRTQINTKSPDHQIVAAQWCITLAKWTLAIGLLTSLLFAHGCHGDEDHELFNHIAAWATQK